METILVIDIDHNSELMTKAIDNSQTRRSWQIEAVAEPQVQLCEGFATIGKVSRPKDTDLCIRASKFNGGGWVYEQEAIAGQQVPADRITISYFLKRCFSEGQGKAELASLNRTAESISTERAYTRDILSAGVARGLRDSMRGEISGAARSCATIACLSSATTGFVADRLITRAAERGDQGLRAAVRR